MLKQTLQKIFASFYQSQQHVITACPTAAAAAAAIEPKVAVH
jgi:hypothetical protein